MILIYIIWNLKGDMITDIKKYIDAFCVPQAPEEGSEEWKLLDACINPREWI